MSSSGNFTNYCDVGTIASLDLTDLAGTFYVNVVVFVLLLALFERTRHKRSVYSCRQEKLKHRVPPELPRGAFGWLWPLMRIPQEKVLSYVGLDAFMLLRYIRFCRRVCLFSGILNVIILVPLYLHGDPDLKPDKTYIWRNPMVISLQNLKYQPRLFWVPVLLAYIATGLVYYLLKYEYRRFLELRLYFVSVGDPDVHPQKNFSVLVDRIPYEHRSNLALYNLFDEVFPGQVHSAVVSLRIEELEDLVQKRAWVLNRLEKAIAYERTRGRPPQHWVATDDSWCSYLTCRGRRVDSVEYYEECLSRLNATISSSQEVLRKDTDALDREEEVRHESQAEQGRTPKLTWQATRRAVSEFLVGDPETRASLLEAEYLSRARQQEEEGAAAGRQGPLGQDGEAISGDGIAINALPGSSSPPALGERVMTCLGDWTVGVFKAGVRTGQVAIRGARQVTKAVGLLTLGSSVSSTGFVTFKSITCAATASQVQMVNMPFVFKISSAPEPRDVIWANVATPTAQIEWREFSTSCLFAFLSLFWSIVVTGLYKVQSVLNTLQQEVFSGRQPTGVETAVSVGIEYVPTLLLLIILQLLPLLFWYSSYRYERLRTHSDIQASVLSRFFYYQMVNIYVTIVGGIMLSEIEVILRNPRTIVTILGCQLPVVAIYFCQVILTKTLSATIWEFGRFWPLLQMWFYEFCCSSGPQTARQRRQGAYAPPVAQLGWIYPSLLLVFTLCLTYDVIMPVMLILGALYFSFAECMYRFHFLYVYVPQYEGGGKLFYAVFNRTLVALLLSHITLIGYCVVLEATVVVPFLVPLPLTILPFYRHCQRGYFEPSIRLSLLAARRIDEELERSAKAQQEPDKYGGSSATASGTSAEGKGGEDERPETPSLRSPAAKAIVDYFELSAYAQPSLTEPPQEPEKFVWAADVTDAPPSSGRRKGGRGFSNSLTESLVPSGEDERGTGVSSPRGGDAV